MLFITKLAISLILSYVTSELFAPDPPRRSGDKDKNTLDQEEVPTAEVGKTIPAVFGHRWVTSPNVVFWRKTKTEKEDKVYRKHFVDMHMAVCHAPVEAVTHIAIDKKIPVAAFPITEAELIARPSQLVVKMAYKTAAGGVFETILATWAEPSREYTGNTTGQGWVTDDDGNTSYDVGDYINEDITTAATGGYTKQRLPIAQGTTPEAYKADASDYLDDSISGRRGVIKSALNMPDIKDGLDGYIEITIWYGDKKLAGDSKMVGDYVRYSTGDWTRNTNGFKEISFNSLVLAGAKITHVGTVHQGLVNPLFSINAYFRFAYTYQEPDDGATQEMSDAISFDFDKVSAPIVGAQQVIEGVSGCVPLGMPNLFGGYKEGGGIEGNMCIINEDSDTDQEVLDSLVWLHGVESQHGGHLLDDKESTDYSGYTPCRYRGTLSVLLKDTYVVANAGSIRPWHFGIRSRPTSLVGAEAYARIGNEANAACVMYEVLTNKVWGKGLPLSAVERDTFVSAAKMLHEESLGISIVWNKETTIDDFIDVLAKHAFGTWRVDIFNTGKVQFHLFREFTGNYNDLHTINPLNISTFKRKSAQEVTNEVQVKWKEYTHVADVGRIAYARNMAHISRNGGSVNSSTMDFPGLATKDAAQYLAELNLESDGYPLAVIDFTEDIMSGSYLVGDHILVNQPRYVDKPTIFRVTDIKATDKLKNVVAVEDVFAYTALLKDTVARSDHTGLLTTPVAQDFIINPFTNSTGSLFITGTSGQLSATLVKEGIKVTASDAEAGTHILNVTAVDSKGVTINTGVQIYVEPKATHTFSLNPVTISMGVGGSETQGLPGGVRGYKVVKESNDVGLTFSTNQDRTFTVAREGDTFLGTPYHLELLCRDIFNAEAVLAITVI